MIACVTRSLVSGSPSSEHAEPFRGSARRSSPGRPPSPPRRRAGRAGCPPARPRSWRGGAGSKSSRSAASSMPARRAGGRRSPSGKVVGTTALSDAELAAGARAASRARSRRAAAPRGRARRSRTPRRGGARARGLAMRARLHRVDDDVPAPVRLRVEERVGMPRRNLVPHLRRADGVGVEQHVGHGAAILFAARTLRTCGDVLERADTPVAAVRRGAARRRCRASARDHRRAHAPRQRHRRVRGVLRGARGGMLDRYGVSRAFMFCMDEPDRHPAFRAPNDRTLAHAERSQGRLDAVRPPRPQRGADRRGGALPRPRRPRDQAAPARAALRAQRRAPRAGVRARRRPPRADPDPRRPRAAADRRPPGRARWTATSRS